VDRLHADGRVHSTMGVYSVAFVERRRLSGDLIRGRLSGSCPPAPAVSTKYGKCDMQRKHKALYNLQHRVIQCMGIGHVNPIEKITNLRGGETLGATSPGWYYSCTLYWNVNVNRHWR